MTIRCQPVFRRQKINPFTTIRRRASGWLTAANSAIKFAFAMLALTAMMCTTPFALMLEAMRKLGDPVLLTVQLGFLYRYIFVLIDQAMRIRLSRDFRGTGAGSRDGSNRHRRAGRAGRPLGTPPFRRAKTLCRTGDAAFHAGKTAPAGRTGRQPRLSQPSPQRTTSSPTKPYCPNTAWRSVQPTLCPATSHNKMASRVAFVLCF